MARGVVAWTLKREEGDGRRGQWGLPSEKRAVRGSLVGKAVHRVPAATHDD